MFSNGGEKFTLALDKLLHCIEYLTVNEERHDSLQSHSKLAATDETLP